MRNRNWNRVPAALLPFFVVLIVLAGCGSSSDHPDANLSGEPPGGISNDDDGDDTSDDTTDDTADDTADDKGTIAIIHNNNETGGGLYGALLNYYDFQYFLIDESDLPGADFDGADAIGRFYIDGKEVSSLPAGQVVVTRTMARDIYASAGDSLSLFYLNNSMNVTVLGVLDARERGMFPVDLFLNLGDMQAGLFGAASGVSSGGDAGSTGATGVKNNSK
jgi:hypothetical protein